MQKVPKHIAIIMDGNGRWAQKRHLPRLAGHQAGVEAVRRAIKVAAEHGVEVLSLFAFSTENWRRPAEEISHLMGLLLTALRSEVKKLHKRNVKLRMIGDKSAFSDKIQKLIADAEALTSNNTGMQLVVAANYGGRWDIVEAAKQMASKVKDGALEIHEISDQTLAAHLATKGLPDPDLFIRTSGEMRISNFFLWQFAYSEFYFSDVLWPDFSEADFQQALEVYASRERRYGAVSNKQD